MTWDEMGDIERLALMQALFTAIGEETRRDRPGNLRGRVASAYLELYEATGARSFDVRVAGEKVGTFSFSKTRARPEAVERVFEVADADALACWEDSDFLAFCARKVAEGMGELARLWWEETGEVPPGCKVDNRVIPAEPEGIKPGGTLRVDPAKVARAMGPALGEAVRGALGAAGETD